MAEFDEKIHHSGLVVGTEKDYVLVKIRQTSACDGCHAAHVCSASSGSEKVIMAVDSTGTLKNGEEVELEGSYKTGSKAVILSYVIPCMLIIITLLVGGTFFEISDLWLGLCSLAILVPYYVGLRVFHRLYDKEFVFTARSKEE